MKKPSFKQIAALSVCVILILLYLLTFLAAAFDRSESGKLFLASLFCTITLPVLIWVFLRFKR